MNAQDQLTTVVDGLVVYLAIVAAAVLVLLVAVKAKTWLGFLFGSAAVVLGAFWLIVWAANR